jgi:ABC-2 type transport system permease protein
MRPTAILALRELRSYFATPLGVIYLVVFGAGTQWLFLRYLFPENMASMQRYFTMLPWILIVFLPALTMRTWAEERKLGTLEVLITYPIVEWQAVLAKWLAVYAFCCLAIAQSIPLAITLTKLGRADGGQLAAQYLGALLLCGLYASLGCFLSSVTENQMVAFLLTVVVLFAIYLAAQSIVIQFVPFALARVLSVVGALPHYEAMTRGVVDTGDVCYFVSSTTLGLYLTLWQLGRRHVG